MSFCSRLLAFSLFGLSLGVFANAGDAFFGGRDENRREKASVFMLLENDVFSGEDENYTNGFTMGYISEMEDKDDLGFFSRTLGTLNGGGNSSSWWSDFMGMPRSSNPEHQWGINITQLMFTPQSLESISTPITTEHPYGAWLAVGFTSIVKNEDRSNTLTFYAGTVGKNALGEPIQDIVHDVMQSPKWEGWDNQLPNEITFMLSFERKYRMRWMEHENNGWGSDGYASWAADLGNVYIRGGSSLYFRYGYNLPASCAQVGWEPNNNNTIPFAGMNSYMDGNWSLYAFGGLRGNVVGYDVFLDGTMFRDSPVTISKYPFVGDMFLGLCWRYKNMDMIFGCTRRSKEYPSQRAPQWMGTVSLRYCF